MEDEEIIARGSKEILRIAKELRKIKSSKKRQQRIEIITNQLNIKLDTTIKYSIIYADPPWRYNFTGSEGRKIENHYPTMELEEICNLRVKELSNKNSMLFLWSTSPLLVNATKVIESWGFKYLTNMVWNKQKMGLGHYARQQHETLLIASRGSMPTPKPENRPRSIISIARTKHSKKPYEFYEIIEKMYPEYNKIELFSREKRKGWECWGNEFK